MLALQFAASDQAVERVRQLRHIIPGLIARPVLFAYKGNNEWEAVDG